MGGIGHYAAGGPLGGLSPSVAMPSWAREEERDSTQGEGQTGFLNSVTAGRTDRLPLAVAADSHVIPADVVSGLGQGNSLGGAAVLNAAFRMGPYSTALPGIRHGSGSPRPPAPFHQAPMPSSLTAAPSTHLATGGKSDLAPILAAGGEFIVPKSKVAEIGGGDLKLGHRLLDKMIAKVRAHTINFLKTAPPPKK